MPGPEALRKREYYGFPGNHFWKILPDIFESACLLRYQEKIKFLKNRRVAIWDVAKTCFRDGALDSAIKEAKPNDIIRLIKKYPSVTAIFLNGRKAEQLFRKYFGGQIKIPVHYLPSTSPANASISYKKKLEKWKRVTKYLANRNPWC